MKRYCSHCRQEVAAYDRDKRAEAHPNGASFSPCIGGAQPTMGWFRRNPKKVVIAAALVAILVGYVALSRGGIIGGTTSKAPASEPAHELAPASDDLADPNRKAAATDLRL